VTRLEQSGKVRREVDPADRRKWFTILTSDGDRTLREAWTTHNDVLRRTLFSATSAAERLTLQRIWQRLAAQQRDRVPAL
jgi:DNA-binding MarR family transcriptional regulator